MTAIAAFVGAAAEAHRGIVARMLGAMPNRGQRHLITTLPDGAVIGASTLDWQRPWTGDAIGRCGDVWVVADATLYYVDSLREKLRQAGIVPASGAPADLIAAAVQRWGADAASYVEGDFAFVAVDTASRRIVAARDWSGLRTLYFRRIEQGLAFATEAWPLMTEGPLGAAQLNLPWLCEAASGRFESPAETAVLGVHVLPAGYLLDVSFDTRDVAPSPRRYFEPPRFLEHEEPAVPFDQARRDLYRLLERAVQERLPAEEEVVVALSGGRDSTAVYALARQLVGPRARSVSVSFPVGDPGREDEVIQDVLACCGGEPYWIDSATLGVVARLEDQARDSPEPFGHPFGAFQEALARGARAQGARVLLNGSGGDQFFSGEPTYLADLLREGRLVQLAAEWLALEEVGAWRAFFRLAIWPNLTASQRGFLERVLRRPLPDPFDSPLAPWVRRDTALRATLDARHRRNFPSRDESVTAEDFERRWLLLHPFYPRVFADAFRLFLANGVELRTPLADLRLMQFAATRPRRERRRGWEMKLLLRSCLNNVLPPSVTGPRRRPSGTTERLFRDAFMAHMGHELSLIERAGTSLHRLGVVDDHALVSELRSALTGGATHFMTAAAFTILADHWLKAHIRLPSTAGSSNAGRDGPPLAVEWDEERLSDRADSRAHTEPGEDHVPEA